MYKFPASKLACELPSAGYIQLRELASHWVFAFGDPGPEKQDSIGVPIVMTERNINWLCVNEGQLNLLFYLKSVALAAVVILTHKIKQGAYMRPQVL